MSSLKHVGSRVLEPRRTAPEAARHAVAAALRRASTALALLSLRLSCSASRLPRTTPRLEFHAEPGAAEGALYLDGKLVGWVTGVNRL